MPRSDLLRPTFRLKLLIALIGTITPLLLLTLLVVRREANHQIEAIVQSTAERAGEAFAQIEQIRQQQLTQLGARLANSNRWGAAMQQALEGDVPFFADVTNYELQLAGVSHALIAVTDLSAAPIAAVVSGKLLPNVEAAVSQPAIDRLFAGDSAIFGYHLIGRQLFSIHPIVINLGEPIGILLLGFSIDDATARALGQAIGADVCFMANGTCAASSGRLSRGKEFATVTRPLAGAAGGQTVLQLRIPLDEAVRPFASIQRSIRYAGLAVLALAILIAVILSRGLARPVRALVSATARVARGDYDTRVHVKSRDEIGMLAAAFNEMTHGLMLKEKYRGVLDKVISKDVADEMLKGEITLGGELREVTTLFADVRGFTPMSQGMPPQEVVSLLNDIMEHAEAAVVAEGGVVDKYVGDEIMALFGAPIARGDDALRAIRAGLRMQDEIKKINVQRAEAHKPSITLGVGINTGTVVAGNMGSARRLNYTVLGAAVNLASRLCGQARGGQVLVTRATLDRVAGRVRATALGTREIKGISEPVELFQIDSAEVEPLVAAASSQSILGIIAVLMIAATSSAYAQRSIAIGPLQVSPSARVDLLAFVPDRAPAYLVPETDPFLAPRVSLFADVFAGAHAYGLLELRLDRGEAPSAGRIQARVEQAFVRLTPFSQAKASLQLGRFISPFGAYPERHHTIADPFIRPPLSYDYRTVVNRQRFPLTNDGFFNWKDDPATFRTRGAPAVWDTPYQLGALAMASIGNTSVRVAVMNGAPSAEPNVWNAWPRNAGDVSFVANVALQISPELRVGGSFNNGPYIDPAAASQLPAGRELSDYTQRLVGIDATFTRGFVELRAEVIHDRWGVPRVADDAVDLSYYAEGKLKLNAGLFIAARFGAITFNDLRSAAGARAPWDYDVRRVQLGAGYRVSERIDVRGEVMLNDSDAPSDPRDNLIAFQASWTVN